MSSTVSEAQRVQAKPKGFIGKTINLPFAILGLLLVSLLLSIILEWIGIFFFWREEGWHHSQMMFNTELGWLNDNFKQSLVVSEPGSTIVWLLQVIYEWLFVKTGFVDFTSTARTSSQQGNDLATVYILIEDYLVAIIYVTLTFIVRVMVLVLSIPLFMMAMLTGFTEGLVRRDLRRFGAGRESSFIYHRAKRLITPLLIAPWFIYLSCPVSVNPVWVLIPCAIALGIAVTVTAATFKKYL